MKLIVGLGNPGNKYVLTRHNIGFIAVDYVSDYLKLSFKEGKGDWHEFSGTYNGTGFFVIKPVTYMNNSGTAVLDFVTKHKIALEDILIVYDDFQIPLGTIRVRENGSDGGHNGISSIIYHLNTLDFPRMRIGIGGNQAPNKEQFVDFVLTNFEPDEIEKIKTLMPHYKDCILSFIGSDIRTTMNSFNKNFLESETPLSAKAGENSPGDDEVITNGKSK